MDYVYFSFMNRLPLGKRADISDNTGLNKGLDLLMMMIGDYPFGAYPDRKLTPLILTKLRVYTRYSIQIGIVYLSSPQKGLYPSQYLLKSKRIRFIQKPQSIHPLPWSFDLGFIGEGLNKKTLTRFIFGGPEVTEDIPAAGFFEKLWKGDVRWHATLKPYSWRASSWWELPAPLRVPRIRYGEWEILHAFIVILIGDAPSMMGNDPIYVSGELGYEWPPS
jgi:hypothetical protein